MSKGCGLGGSGGGGESSDRGKNCRGVEENKALNEEKKAEMTTLRRGRVM